MLKISQSTSAWLLILVFAALGLPSFVMVVGDIHLDPILSAMIFGHGIVGGAFLISWAAEAAQVDVSASFAITILALIAIYRISGSLIFHLWVFITFRLDRGNLPI